MKRVLSAWVIFVASLVFAQEVPANLKTSVPPFDVNDVIKQVHQNQSGFTTGEFLIDTSVVYVPAPNGQYSSAIAFDGTNYLVVWHDMRSNFWDIYGARVNQIGVVLDPAGIAISTAPSSKWLAAVAFDGTNYLVIWEDTRNGLDIYGARVSQEGVVLDPAGIAISTAANSQEDPVVAFDGTNYLVVWQDMRSDSLDIYGARVNQMGVVLDPNGIAISTTASYQSNPSVAFDGTNILVVWHDFRSGSNSDIYGARVGQSGMVLDSAGIAISTTEDWQWSPAVAFDGTNYQIVWGEYRSGPGADIYGARVSINGTVLDTLGFAISTATSSQEYPSIAFDGTNYLVVWEDRRNSDDPDIYGARVSQEGVVLDPNGIAISTAASSQGYPSIAFDGTNYLVVWHDMRGNANLDIYGARVSRGGVVLDTNGIAISTVTYSQNFPSVSFDGTNYLVVWEDCRNYPHTDIYGARVSQEGVVLDTNGIGISTVTYSQLSPSISFDGTNYLVVWEDYRNSQSYSDIYGTRVSQRGAVLDPNGFAISTTNHRQRFPSSVFDGTNYLVVWEDCQNGYNYDIYGARVSPLGIVIDSFTVSTQSGNQYHPVIAHGQGSQVLIAYPGWVDYINSRPANTYRIWGKFLPQVGIEERSTANAKRSTLEIYPNPFRARSIITFSLPHRGSVRLRVYNAAGAVVRVLINERRPAGSYRVEWNGRDDRSRELPNGVYFYQLQTGNFVDTKKAVILR